MDLQNNWLKYGIIYAAISILISLISFYVYQIGIWTMMLVSFVIMIIIFIAAAKAEKSLNDGILPYGKALKLTFLTGFVGFLIASVFSIILTTLIDPSVVDVIREQALESSRSLMEKLGTPEDVISEAMDKAEEDFDNRFTVTGQLLNILTSSIFVLIIAAIVSIFVKKDEQFA
ncbi:MAG: DUF4199 domain-containing protein [Saprospiraceae bacterium]|nr:DUF4199 domain-containing protein [Saprospiraceae bacterium]